MPTEADELAGCFANSRATWTHVLRRCDPQCGDLVRRLSATAHTFAEAIDGFGTALGRAGAGRPGRGASDGEVSSTRVDRPRRSRTTSSRILDGSQTDDVAATGRRPPAWLGRRRRDDARGCGERRALTRTCATAPEGSCAQRVANGFAAVETALDLLAEQAPTHPRTKQPTDSPTEGFARGPFDPIGLSTQHRSPAPGRLSLCRQLPLRKPPDQKGRTRSPRQPETRQPERGRDRLRDPRTIGRPVDSTSTPYDASSTSTRRRAGSTTTTNGCSSRPLRIVPPTISARCWPSPHRSQ